MNCTRWFKIFYIFVFENTHLGIRIDAKTVFTFLFFLWMPLKNQRSMMKKTVKISFFTFFVPFRYLKNASWTSRPGSKNRLLSVTLRTWKIQNTTNNTKTIFSTYTGERSQKHVFFKFFPSFFFTFQVRRVFDFSILVWWPLLISFHVTDVTEQTDEHRFLDPPTQ